MSGERDENGAKINAHRICETENEPLFLLYVFVLLLFSHRQLVSHIFILRSVEWILWDAIRDGSIGADAITAYCFS